MRTPSYQFCCLIQLYPNKLSGFPQIATLWGTCCSVFQSCPTLCDSMDCSMPGSSVFHYLPEFFQIHLHRVGDATQPSHPLLPSSPFTFNFSEHQGFFQQVGSSIRCPAAAASVMSDSVRPHRWQPTRLLCPQDSPGRNTGVGCHFLLQSGAHLKAINEYILVKRIVGTFH